jgi:DtxR family Mn-dependent transcriptional regulator
MLTGRILARGEITPSMQHYLRTILEVHREKGHVRVTDVAYKLGVGKAAVSLALKGLVGRGLIRHPHYQFIELTPEGAREAQQVMGHFAVLRHFLEEVLGVRGEQAEIDACLMEHFVSGATVDRLVDLIRFFEQDDELVREALRRFQQYKRTCESAERCPSCEFSCDVAFNAPGSLAPPGQAPAGDPA